jgi:hypothetical protein
LPPGQPLLVPYDPAKRLSPKWKANPSVSGFVSSAINRCRAANTATPSTSGLDGQLGCASWAGMWNASPKAISRPAVVEIT